MQKSIIGDNTLTVLVAKPEPEQSLNKRMFFCPYTKCITLTYQGQVKAIYPGSDPEETPQFVVRPQRIDYNYNINYSFRESQDREKTINFWIQDQYFRDEDVKLYHCFNCQAPQLYFTGNKAVRFPNKADIKKGESYQCSNPNCLESLPFTFMGIVAIRNVNAV